MYTKDEYYKRYHELLELTGDTNKASLQLAIEHNGWDAGKLIKELDKSFKRKHLTLVINEEE